MNSNQQPPLNPGLSEREIEEILTSSGVINGTVMNGIKLGAAIADIIAKNNQLLLDALQSGQLTRAPYDDPASGPHQTVDPTRMWEAGTAPGTEMPASRAVTPPGQSQL